MIPDLPLLFRTLSERLQQSEHYWQPRAFYHTHLPWMEQHPTLARQLLSLSPQQIDALSTKYSALVDFLADDIPVGRELATLITLPPLPLRPLPVVSPHFSTGIPGRKWQQVQAFAACLPDAEWPLLEWCSGKSHLGFLLYHCHRRPVIALEWNSELVSQANKRARRDCIPLHANTVDVLATGANDFLRVDLQVVALHACGELHEHLLRQSVAKGVKQLHIAPCCYHKRSAEHYIPLSALGRQTALHMDRKTLHTAVSETATAGATVQRQRTRLQIMRLGFDYLQREARGVDAFLPLPSLPMRWAQASFEAFCRHCAQLNNMTLPATVDWEHYRQLGEKRFWQVAALDLVRFLFRRPLEVWLVLDRALYLQEQGYQVEIGEFCSSALTPRNLLIQARLK